MLYAICFNILQYAICSSFPGVDIALTSCFVISHNIPHHASWGKNWKYKNSVAVKFLKRKFSHFRRQVKQVMCVQCTCWNASETIARMEEGSLNSVLRCIFCGRQITKYIDAHCNKVEFWSVLAFFVAFSCYKVHFGTFEQISSKF